MHSVVCGTGTPKDRDEVKLGSAGKHTVSLVLVVSEQETVGLVRHSRNQSVECM